MTGRRPFNVRCGACSHEWAPFYLPMELATCAAMLKSARCPMCGNGPDNLFAGTQPPKQEDPRQ
jgi:hypothetical protein